MSGGRSGPDRLSVHALLDLLEEVERTIPVDRWVLDGVHVWPLIRIELAYALNEFVGPAPPPRPSLRGKLRTAGRLLTGLPGHWRARRSDRPRDLDPTGPVDAVFLSMSTARRFKHAGRWYCNFSDPILDRFEPAGLSGAVLEFSPRGEYRLPRHRPSRLIQPELDALRWLGPLDARDGTRLAAAPGFLDFCACVTERTEGSYTPAAADYETSLARLRRRARWLGRYLDRLRPAVGLSFGWYDPEGMAFDLACAERGIASVDVQHGVQSVHVAYGRWSRLPPGGYQLLPRLFCCWTESDAGHIRAWAARTGTAHDAIAIGNQAALAARQDPLLADLEQPLPPRDSATDAREILVLLGLGELPASIRDVMERAPRGWRFWVRLHPAGHAELPRMCERWRHRPQVEVRLASTSPLYALLRRVDAVLTEASSAVMEAEQFGVTSILCHPLGASLYREQIERGWAVACDSADAVLRELALPSGAARAPVAEARVGDGFDRLLEFVAARRRTPAPPL